MASNLMTSIRQIKKLGFSGVLLLKDVHPAIKSNNGQLVSFRIQPYHIKSFYRASGLIF